MKVVKQNLTDMRPMANIKSSTATVNAESAGSSDALVTLLESALASKCCQKLLASTEAHVL